MEKVSARNEKISTLVHGHDPKFSTISHNGGIARPGSEFDCRNGIPLSKREDLKPAYTSTAQNLEMPGAGAPQVLTKTIQHVAVQQSQPFHVSQAQTITPPQPSSLPANIVPVHIVSDDGKVKIAAKKGRFTIIETPIKKEGLIATGIHVPVASNNQQLTQQQIVQLPLQQHAQHHGLAQKNDLLINQAQSASIGTSQPQIVKVTSASIIEQPSSHNGNGTLPNTLIQQSLPVQQQQVLNMQRSVEIGNVSRNDTITDPLIPVAERKGRFIVTKAADSNPALHVRANSLGATQDQINHVRTTNVQQNQASRINNQTTINSGSHQMAPPRHGSDGHPTTSTSGGYMNKGLPPPVPKVSKVSAVDRINASVTSGGISKGGLSSAVPGGMGKMFHFLDQLKLEVVEADKMIKTLQNDVKFLRGKNKELEARCNESETRYMEEKASREESDAKIRSLKKRLKEMREQKETKSHVTITSSATSIPMPPIMHHGESGVLITESQPFNLANGKKVEGRNKVSTTQEAQKRVPSKSQVVRGVGLKAVAATERSTSEPLLNLTSIGIGSTSTNGFNTSINGFSTSSPSEMPTEDAFSDLSASIENAFDSFATF